MIANAAELARSGNVASRRLALRIAEAGLAACDVSAATERSVALRDDGVAIRGQPFSLDAGARLLLVGAGKATMAIAAALERVLGDRLDAGVVVVREGERIQPLERVEVIAADHPLPSECSVDGAERLLRLADRAEEGDLVLASFTGGSSALASLPPAGVTPSQKRRLHELLLGSGAPIVEINTVRKHVSAFKGGRLAACAAPARLVNLTVSDVADDVLDVLTDPSVQDTSTAADAIEVLHRRKLWDLIPATVREHLESGAAESPSLTHEPETVLLVTGATVCAAMEREAAAAGVGAHLVSTALEGEAAELGRALAELGSRAASGGGPVGVPCVLLGCGGEATVSLPTGAPFGEGGPNQEVAIAAALRLREQDQVAACFLDTDGSDGGTAAAGAIVDGETVARAATGGIDLETALATHRCGRALAALGDQIVTGPTGTNVNDLFVVAVGSDHRASQSDPR